MAIGLGIVLIVLGLIFALDVINVDTSAVVQEHSVGSFSSWEYWPSSCHW